MFVTLISSLPSCCNSFLRRVGRAATLSLIVLGSVTGTAQAQDVVSCGGAAMLGGAQLACSHVMAKAPAQFCTFSWSLATIAGTLQVVQGSFLLTPGSSNTIVYQGTGFNSALTNPVVLCQGKRSR